MALHLHCWYQPLELVAVVPRLVVAALSVELGAAGAAESSAPWQGIAALPADKTILQCTPPPRAISQATNK